MPDSSTSKPSQVELVASERLSDGYCKLDRLTLRHERFEGGMSTEVTREVIERGRAVGVLLYDPDLDRCVMIEQFRPGSWLAEVDPWELEIVAGMIEAGETPEAVCQREVEEETGLAVHDLFRALHYVVNPGICTETVTFYVGRVNSERAGGIHGCKDEGEDIRVKTMTVDELRWAIETGKAKNSLALIAIQWLLLNHTQLRRRWAA
jgi:ADP-ribose pyrophosphatase